MIHLRTKTLLAAIAVAGAFFTAPASFAALVNLPAPHDALTCGRCHGDHPNLGLTGFSNACLTCHRPGVPRGEQKPFSAADAADRFNRLSSAENLRRISHSWEGSATLAAAGAQAPQSPELLASQLAGTLACSACHSVHTAKGTPLLRLGNDRDQLCLDCHRSRFTDDQTSGSHPINVRYTSATAAPKQNPTAFYLPPRNANPANSSSAPKLTNDTLLCSTCHRVHYADSSSATFDNATSYLQLSAGDGNLLRSDLRGATAASVNICSGCHVKPNHDAKGQNIQCADCHGAHVADDPAATTSDEKTANVYLVRRYMNISTTAGAVRQQRVFLQQTSLLRRPYKTSDGHGVCQACHTVPIGGGFPAEHELASAAAAVCAPCHPHNSSGGAFAPTGGSCTSCHGYPPTSSGHGGPSGAAGSYPRDEGLSAHRTHAGGSSDYRYGCAVCHLGNEHLRGSYQDLYRDTTGSSAALFGAAPTYDGTAFTCSTVYCHSNGAPRNSALTPVLSTVTSPAWVGGNGAITDCSDCHAALPTTNAHGRHLSAGQTCAGCHQATAASNSSISNPDKHVNGVKDVAFAPSLDAATWDVATAGCSIPTCHSNGQGGAPNQLPYWNSTLPTDCSGCHDTSSSTSRLSGRHTKHTAGAYAYSCSRCHTSTTNDDGSMNNQGLHVNGSKDVFFREGGSYNVTSKGCSGTYCHSSGATTTAPYAPPTIAVAWSDTVAMTCYACHKGTPDDSIKANCDQILGTWSSSKTSCTPDLTMASNGHHRLVGPQWVRKYPCFYCHNNTVNSDNTIKSATDHVNGSKDIAMPAVWAIVGRAAPSYNPATKVCNNVYCHSDGTTDPDTVRPFAWTEPKTSCNSCHGHPLGSCKTCHYAHIDSTGKVWTNMSTWEKGEEWRGAMPMFPNMGAGTTRANSHVRHSQTNFTCDNCHAVTVKNGVCTDCHQSGIPAGSMGEVAHIDPDYHVNKARDVVFKDGGSYNPLNKSCANTACHTSGTDPIWGGSVQSAVTCLACHSTSGADQDDFNAFNGTQARISLDEWVTKGHGRYSTSGRYPGSNNPAANFPGNPCWYCHDNNVLHKDPNNPFRLKMHYQYERRFEKECVYCHMERIDAECVGCHVGQTGTLAPQATASGIAFKKTDGSSETKFAGHGHTVTCTTAGSCHDSDSGTFLSGNHKGHNVNAGIWTVVQKRDIKNQYMMMGVCLQCHDDDSGGQCTSCHVDLANPQKFALGYNPGTGLIKPKQARASAGHFGHKHYQGFISSGGWAKVYSATKSPILGTYSTFQGVWKGGKFCWDCHDPHGDSNIFMVQKRVATTTDGIFGRPKTSAEVNFSDKATGYSYARKIAPFNGICNVCHSPSSKHFTSNSGDGHNMSRPCTGCHEHRFADSHANKQSCSTEGCHINAKPVPKHTAFGLPRDCTKCHLGTIGTRMDIIGQMKSNSHHVQRVTGEIKNTDCYQCHWEASSNGLINRDYHTGYDYRNYSTVANDVVDLVIYGPGTRPDAYRPVSTASGRATVALFRANKIGTPQERSEVASISTHCVSCHSDQNNELIPFDDCKTPRQYAWDGLSITTRYSQTGTTSWGKYTGTAGAAKKNFTKAFSAHGNAAANQGGWDPANGLDGDLTDKNQRTGSKNIQCFDCHNSHGSKVVGVTSSYVTYNGTNNGANLKETKKDIGGYAYDYKASANDSGANPYAAGAGQCFDCHNSATVGTTVPTGKTPWGYFATYSSGAPVMGYKDSPRFGNDGVKGFITKNNTNGWLNSRKNIVGGHLKASEPSGSLANLAKDAGTTTSGSATTLSDSSKNWTSNKWRNLYVLLTSGANSGQLSKITGNTTTTLTLEGFPAAVAAGSNYKIVPYSAQVNGLCTPCHDPHGVSPALGAGNQQYAVPLLKGTWLTSPYKEDMPPEVPKGDRIGSVYSGSGDYNGKPRSWGKYVSGNWYANHPSPYEPSTKHNVDHNTFGNNTRISETDSQFAGLCLNCHQKAMLTDGINTNQSWKSVDRIHESVKQWGANREHSFTCSKCHQPHSSGLPRLMLTNCLDYNHRGGIATGGQTWRADLQGGSDAHNRGEHRGFPIGSIYAANGLEAFTACHMSRTAPSTPWPAGNNWNSVTPW